MEIFIEDGQGRQFANSYATVEQLRSHAQYRGVDLPESDDDCIVLLVKAMDYLESLGNRYLGEKATDNQPLQWPRRDVVGYPTPGELYPPDRIPWNLERAQLVLAIKALNYDLLPDTIKTGIKREKIDVIELEYDPDATVQHSFAGVEAHLRDLIRWETLPLTLTRV